MRRLTVACLFAAGAASQVACSAAEPVPQPDRPVPLVIGETLERATELVEEAGYALTVRPGADSEAGDGVLAQWPPADWTGGLAGSVRVALSAPSDVGGTKASVPSDRLRAAVGRALTSVRAERPADWQVVEAIPVFEVKADPCPVGSCMTVHLNRSGEGASVSFDFRRADPFVDVGFQTTAHPLTSGYTEDELVAAAEADPAVTAASVGIEYDAYFLSYGAPGGTCPEFAGSSTCATVVLGVRDGVPGLVSVNFLTLEVELIRPPQAASPSAAAAP